ncbi:MFS transporter [Soonwooa sp.]|uniref:MFS transporter n=1 Tax=Soonwooa sp. TaxID=1938592 RepID=UPI0028AAE93F|nr:MFS transporter [Soonwooa sp.]
MEAKALRVSLIVGATFLMENLDSTVITTALPQMAKSFDADPLHMSIGVSVYIIMLAVFIPISGWISEKFGVKKVFGTAILGFLVASALCGLSQNLTEFTLARTLQGFFGAMMVPVGRLSVLKNTEKNDLVSAIAFITWPGLIGPILGPFVGGYITTYFSWHWIFFINIPLGLLAFFLAMKYIPDTNERSDRKFDVKGFALSTIGMIGFMLGLESFTNDMLPVYYSVPLMLFSILVFYIFYLHTKKIDNPLLDFSELKTKTYAITIYSGSITRMVIGMAPFLMPLMFQVGFGLTAFESGSLLMASMIGSLVMKPATVWITRQFSFRRVLVANTILLSLTSFAMLLLFPDTPHWMTITVLFISGCVRSMQFSSLNTLAYADVPKERMNNANTLYSAAQQMTLGMGITLGAFSLKTASLFHGTEGHYNVKDFHLAFAIIGILGLVTLYEYLKLSDRDGINVRNMKSRKRAKNDLHKTH